MESEIQFQLKRLLSIVSLYTEPPKQKIIDELIEVGEWGIAWETMFEILYEDEISISYETYRLVKDTASSLELNSHLLDELKSQIS